VHPPALVLAALALVLLASIGCGWNPAKPFERNAPEVDRATGALDAGEAGAAADLLERYLQTGQCTEGSIGVPDRVRERPNASFDLGLALFHVAERFGRRFGEEDLVPDGGPTPQQQTEAQLRADQAECAIKVLRAIAAAPETPVALAARAHYLAGNIEFLRRKYQDAVSAYDEALRLIPGVPDDAGDGIGRDAAWNRAVALRRIEEEKKRDAGRDAPDEADGGKEPDTGVPEAGDDGPKDAGPPDAPDKDKGDSGKDDKGDGGDKGKDSGADSGREAAAPKNDPARPEAGAPPPQSPSQDERMLDALAAAPSVQLQDAKNRAARRRVRGMADK
jgi:tetratricopeptide (TPR) repeat protein